MTVYKAERVGRRDAEREAFSALAQRGLLGSVELVDVEVGTSDTRVAHHLGRRPRAWVVIDVTGSARVWRTAPSDELFLTLRATAPVTLALLVW